MNKGFTLIECLLTLLLLSILLLLPTLFSNSNQLQMEERSTIEKLRNDLVYAQHLAMTEGKKVTVFFEGNELILFYNRAEQMRFQYPIDMQLKSITMSMNDIAFLANGHPNKAGSWDVFTEHMHARFSIQIGKGRIVYREQ